MPSNVSEWIGFAIAVVNGVLVLAMIADFVLAFIEGER